METLLWKLQCQSYRPFLLQRLHEKMTGTGETQIFEKEGIIKRDGGQRV